MPKAYEAMRNKFAQGAPVDSPEYDAAQSKAAAIYNSKHKSAPVTGKSDKKKAKKKGKKKAKAVGRDSFAADLFGA
jgi:hypothetical protein